MAIAGFAVMNPIAAMSMVDTSRWRPVVYADTPRTLGRYHSFLQEKRVDNRKVVLFLLGGLNLSKVGKDRARFSSVLVFDAIENLHSLRSQIDGFEIADIGKDKNDLFYPRHLTPIELMEVIERPGNLPDPFPLLSKVTNALGKRRPSVLEATSRLPVPDAVPFSGVQRRLTDLKEALAEDSKVTFSVLLDVFVKYLFRVVDRAYVTSAVTKKLPADVKDAWAELLDFATSDIGKTMAVAYRALCLSDDADYRVGHAVNDYNLKSYSGDFLYLTSVLPPTRSCEFLPGVFDDTGKPFMPLVKVFKPPAVVSPAKSRGKKKARGQG